MGKKLLKSNIGTFESQNNSISKINKRTNNNGSRITNKLDYEKLSPSCWGPASFEEIQKVINSSDDTI